MDDPFTLILLGILLFFVAALYSSVGHGGASGYLAVLSFFAFTPAEMATTALTLNVLVAAVAFLTFRAAGHFRLSLLAPFLIASVPAAFLGGMLNVPPRYYAWLLGTVLLFTAIRLAWTTTLGGPTPAPIRHPSVAISLPTGAGIGFLSGIVGVGGGIFLSPVLLLMRWATVRETAAVSAAFIWVNSLSGLAGRATGGNLDYGSLLWFVPIAFAGGVVGAQMGAHRVRGRTLRYALAAVLLLATLKLMIFGL